MPKWSKREKREIKNIQDKLIDEEELRMILKGLPRTSKGKELGLAIEISYHSGLRLSEVLGLKPEDITFDGSVRLSVIGKGSKARVTFMPLRFKERLIGDFKGFNITAPYVKKMLSKESLTGLVSGVVFMG